MAKFKNKDYKYNKFDLKMFFNMNVSLKMVFDQDTENKWILISLLVRIRTNEVFGVNLKMSLKSPFYSSVCF